MSSYIKNGNTNKLITRYDEVLAGNFSFTTVLGDAGTGKSFLLSTQKEFFETNTHIISYKSNKHSMNSFSSIEGMLAAITNYIYTLPSEEYKQIIDRLVNEHMVHYESLSSFSPVFARLLSKRVVRRQISTKKVNLMSLLNQLIESLSEVLYPLVLFFDDIQWMDDESFDFLRLIQKNNVNIYVILAGRPSELSQGMISSDFITKEAIIKLEPFTKEDTYRFITISTNEPQDKIFSDTVYLLTGGNPFYTNFVITQLIDENPEKKDFTVMDLNKIEFTTDNPNVLISQLDRLNLEEMKVLSLFACLDRGLEEELLHKVGISVIIIQELCKRNLLSKIEEKYFIVHDIVKYTVYDILSEQQLEEYHFKLLKNLYDENLENSFYVYLIMQSNLNDILSDRAEEYLRTVIEVAIIDREKGDIQKSLRLLKYASRIQNKVKNKDLDYIIKINTMECEYINENVFYAQALYNELLREFPENSIETKLNFISFYAFNAEWEKVLVLGNELLSLLGYPLTKFNQLRDIISYRRHYSLRNIRKLEKLERVQDPYIFDVLEVLTIMIPAANRIDIDTFNKIALKLAVLVAKHGYSEYSAIGFSMASLIQYFVFKNVTLGNTIQEKIIQLLESKDDQFKTIPYALLGTFTHHWSHPYDESMGLLQKSYEYSGRDNEFLFSNYALVFHVITLYVNGSSLDTIIQYMNGFNRETSRLEDFLLKHMFELYRTQLDYLRNGEVVYHFTPAYKNSFDETIILNHKMLQVHQLYLEQRFKEAFELAEEIDPLVWAHDGFVLNGHFAFYGCLTRIRYFEKAQDKAKNEKTIQKLISFMEQWINGENIDHIIQYKVALLAWIRENGKNVEVLVKELSDLVLKTINKPLRAIVHMMLAEHYKVFREVSEVFERKVYDDLKSWGASYIASLYQVEEAKEEKEIPKLKEIKEYINMSDFEVTKYYIDYLIQNTSVSNIGICFEKNDNLFLKYKFGQEASELDNVNINLSKDVPQKVLRYTFRSGEEYLKDDLFCMPLKESDVLSGVIFMSLSDIDDVPFVRNIVDTYLPIHTKKKTKVVELAEKLTKREIEILQLVSLGYSNDAISKRAFVTIGTIRNHLSSVYRKLSVSNRVQAIIVAKEIGIIE